MRTRNMSSGAAKSSSMVIVTGRWTVDALRDLQLDETNQAPVITSAQAQPMSPDLDVWDAWPLADVYGKPVAWKGGELWFALAAARAEDPEQRHRLARIHRFHRIGDHFEHLGTTLPQQITPAAREWSGSARYDAGKVTLFFTAAGQKGDQAMTYHQRLFLCHASMSDSGELGDWSTPREFIVADGEMYRPANESEGIPGQIKAFRDPTHFRDRDGRDYVLFTGSTAGKPSSHDGVIGLAAELEDGKYDLLPPLIDASGTNNELERAHIVAHGGALYLFWSTQRGVFAPGIAAPTGLYGATAASLGGPWTLLNGHGLVIANPVERPTQTYSWWVLPDLTVTSFVDYWGPEDPTVPEAASRRSRFGGTFAPFLRLALDGDQSRLVADR